MLATAGAQIVPIELARSRYAADLLLPWLRGDPSRDATATERRARDGVPAAEVDGAHRAERVIRRSIGVQQHQLGALRVLRCRKYGGGIARD